MVTKACECLNIVNARSVLAVLKAIGVQLRQRDPCGSIRAVLRRSARRSTLRELDCLYWGGHRTYVFVGCQQSLLWPQIEDKVLTAFGARLI